MRFQFLFKHMAVSPALQQYTEDKVGAIVGKFVTKPIEAHVTFSVERHLNTVHCDLEGGDGFSLSVSYSCEDMYGSIDRVVDKMGTQLKRHKEKIKTHKGTKNQDYFGGNPDQHDEPVDAADIVKYENARKKQRSA